MSNQEYKHDDPQLKWLAETFPNRKWQAKDISDCSGSDKWFNVEKVAFDEDCIYRESKDKDVAIFTNIGWYTRGAGEEFTCFSDVASDARVYKSLRMAKMKAKGFFYPNTSVSDYSWSEVKKIKFLKFINIETGDELDHHDFVLKTDSDYLDDFKKTI